MGKYVAMPRRHEKMKKYASVGFTLESTALIAL
jgi:hypothetical protein